MLNVFLTKNKNYKISIAIFSTAMALVIVIAIIGIAQANEKPDLKAFNKLNGREIEGSIIITKNPERELNSLRAKGLKSKFVHKFKNRPSVVAVREAPTDIRLKSIDAQADAQVLPNYVYRSLFTPNDPNYSSQWNLTKVSAPNAWDVSRGDSNITIAIIDSGVLSSQTINGATYTQPDLPAGRIWTNPNETGMTQASDTCWTGVSADKSTNDCDDDGNGLVDDWRGWDFMGGFRGNDASCPNNGDPARYQNPSDPTYVDQDNDPQPYSCDSPSSPTVLNKDHYSGTCEAWTGACYVGHGTMVASVAAASADNGQLIAGLDHNAKLMNLRVVDGYGYTTTAKIVSAINYAVDGGADVINMSLGSNCSDNNFVDSAAENALAAAASAGIVSVAASGNENQTNSICYPASSQYVMAVGATDQNDNRRSYSNYSNKLDVVAPTGVPVANAASAYINSDYFSNAGGTSMSTPHVAGLAALLKAKDPSLPRTQIEDLIKQRADKVVDMGGKMFDNQYGYGRINMYTPLSVLDGRLPVYRLASLKTGDHFYTISVSERDKAVNIYSYRYENISFYASSSNIGVFPVYRLSHKITGDHFYTTSAEERDSAVNKYKYKYEGVGFKVIDNNLITIPIYRLLNPYNGDHLYTPSTTERDAAVSRYRYRYEDIGFRTE